MMVATAQAGEQLSIKVARDRAAAYAENACAHDKSCARSGVNNCRRLSDHVVLCRVFDHRKTEEQGNFLCSRFVRLALDPRTHRVPVTGVSDWKC
jgi:hypothetical protein